MGARLDEALWWKSNRSRWSSRWLLSRDFRFENSPFRESRYYTKISVFFPPPLLSPPVLLLPLLSSLDFLLLLLPLSILLPLLLLPSIFQTLALSISALPKLWVLLFLFVFLLFPFLFGLLHFLFSPVTLFSSPPPQYKFLDLLCY